MVRSVKLLNLRRLILLLCFFSVAVTLLNTFYSVYHVYREQVIQNTIESNRVYAKKMAEMADGFIGTSFQLLQYSANILRHNMHNSAVLDSEVERLKAQTDSFNSVGIMDHADVIIAITPETVNIKGVKAVNRNFLKVLHDRKPAVAEPFVSPAGNYLLGISYPIIDENQQYLGSIMGTIYLEKENILTSIFKDHDHADGSYLYVVNHKNTIIYHPGQDRVGMEVKNNPAVSALGKGEQGGQEIINSQGIAMLAGYAPVKSAGWGIVVQSPKDQAMAVLDKHLWTVFVKSLPISILTFLFIWVFAVLISKPLWQLAKSAQKFDSDAPETSDLDNIHPWYFEASNLKNSLHGALGSASNTIEKLHVASLTDPMTGLLNRRGLEKAIEQLTERSEDYSSFSILTLDIDYFKRVNDTYGHDVGDVVLKEVASFISEQARGQDVLCRSGGEEFLMFLVNIDINVAYDIAERIRKSVASHMFSQVGYLTISIGGAFWDHNKQSIEQSMKNADEALYRAKNKGRNRTEIG